MINIGFNWVRIDKGNIHTTFRYLTKGQVETVLRYLKSYYQYRNLEIGMVDLENVDPALPSSERYRPSGYDPNEAYYFLVELSRKGAIIPLGAIDVIKEALNKLSLKEIVPASVFINALGSDTFVIDQEEILTASVSPTLDPNDLTWETSDAVVMSIGPDPDDPTNVARRLITALATGTADITAKVAVEEEKAVPYATMPLPSEEIVGTFVEYVGVTTSEYQNGHYYECVADTSGGTTTYKWDDCNGNPGTEIHYYSSTFSAIVRTYLNILNKAQIPQRICMNKSQYIQAYTPTSELLSTIAWRSTTDAIVFNDGVVAGPNVYVQGVKPGGGQIIASMTDSYGTYEDYVNLDIYALAISPTDVKVVVGKQAPLYIKKADIFNDEDAVITWVSDSVAVATVEPVTPTDPITTYSECLVTGNGVGKAVIKAVAEDPNTMESYQDAIRITVGNVAIKKPASTTINLIVSATMDLEAELYEAFNIPADGWRSSNTNVITVGTPTGTNNERVTITGLQEGSAVITVTGGMGGLLTDSDSIFIKVVNVDTVSNSEMHTFTRGMYDGHGVIDWDHPTGEEGTYDVESTVYDLATEEEVEEFIEDEVFPEVNLEDEEGESSESDESEESGE